jgi:hypothetical protein
MMTQDRRSEFVVTAVLVVAAAGWLWFLPCRLCLQTTRRRVAIDLLCTAGTADRYGVARATE